MKKLIKFLEALKINSNSKVVKGDLNGYDDIDPDDIDRRKKRLNRNGDKYLWYKWWEYLCKNGPTSKKDLLTDFGLQPTSYSTMFAQLSKQNIIVPKGGKLEPRKMSEWYV